jgi:hypothetical protein
VELLLARRKNRQRLRGMAGEDRAGLGEPAATAAALDETLAGRALEHVDVLAGSRLTDPDRARRARDASRPLDLDEQA